MSNQIVPDSFPATEDSFIQTANKPGDEWQELHDFVVQNIPGVDVDTFTDKLLEIRRKHEAELKELSDSVLQEGPEKNSHQWDLKYLAGDVLEAERQMNSKASQTDGKYKLGCPPSPK